MSTVERKFMEDIDIIIDVIVDGRVLDSKEIPPVVSAEIEAVLARGQEPKEIHHEGVRYLWLVRPCVYP
jgi:hypothetical protein